MVLRGEDDKAIPLFKSSVEKALRPYDHGYACGPAIELASIYVKRGNLREAKLYLDTAARFYAKAPRPIYLPRMYEVLSKYYAATGKTALSIAYIDSTLAERKKIEERFNAIQWLRVEQRKHLSEQQLKDEQLYAEKIRTEGHRRSLIILIIASLLITVGLMRYYVLFRKKRTAYHELVRKSQEWARTSATQVEDGGQERQNGIPDTLDRIVMQAIDKIMSDDKLYRDAELTVDTLARKTGYKGVSCIRRNQPL